VGRAPAVGAAVLLLLVLLRGPAAGPAAGLAGAVLLLACWGKAQGWTEGPQPGQAGRVYWGEVSHVSALCRHVAELDAGSCHLITSYPYLGGCTGAVATGIGTGTGGLGAAAAAGTLDPIVTTLVALTTSAGPAWPFCCSVVKRFTTSLSRSVVTLSSASSSCSTARQCPPGGGWAGMSTYPMCLASTVWRFPLIPKIWRL